MRIGRQKKTKHTIGVNINSKYILMFIFITVLLLPGALMISTSIQASHQGSQLSDLEYEISKLEMEVRDLKSEIVKNTSLTEVSEKAEENGFIVPENLVYIQKENQVAQR